MKYLQVLLLCFCVTTSFSQINPVGRYENEGGNIWINSDGTFKIIYHGDMSRAWAIGTWTMNKRNILLSFKPVYDTFTLKTKEGLIDSLFLSDDFNSERYDENSPKTENIWYVIQSEKFFPKILQLKRDKLYIIENGRRLKKMRRSGYIKDAIHPYFIKKENL